MFSQAQNQIYYPTYKIDFYNFINDMKLLNYCQYTQFKYTANTLLITGDKSMLAHAESINICRLWNTNKNHSFLEFIDKYVLI